ncbi:MAG TPA: DUF2950 domain-containing protein [Humisphaera sp.]|nr:DUF2950 domain-containing protein [Humisphaera sp.]
MRYSITRGCGSLVILLAAVLLIGSGCAPQQPPQEQRTFDSPYVAADALVQALSMQLRDQYKDILGPDADELLASGDAVADRNSAETFLKAYAQQHHFDTEGDDHYTLVVGDNDWPMPIPLVKDEKGKWHFDTAAGKEELINRRVGRNELDVIKVCQAIVDAQRDYTAAKSTAGGTPEYAQKFMSDAGQKNGLYWQTADGEPASPLGPLVAEAVEQGYSSTQSASGEPRPYHGYYYRMLKSQGPNAPGGAMDYMANGKLIAGFGVVAYPADYGNSGIMTFITNRLGIVYQKDLGPDTEKLAKAMESFDPDTGWDPVTTDAADADKPEPDKK